MPTNPWLAVQTSGVPATPPNPTPPEQRLELLDAFRGFALLGVFVANAIPWFSGYALLTEAESQALPTARADVIVMMGLRFLVTDKFLACFTFLFGVGFALQAQRGMARGLAVTSIQLRRMLVLLLVGATHMLVFWYGDILAVYACCGLLLIGFQRLPTRWLFAIGLVLTFLWGPILRQSPPVELTSGASS